MNEASEEITMPFFSIKQPKPKKSVRHKNFLEHNTKESDSILRALSNHFGHTKLTRVKLFELSKVLKHEILIIET